MPRLNSPWFRASTNSWYTTLDGKKVPLGVRGQHNRKAALIAFADLLAGRVSPCTRAHPPALPHPIGLSVGGVVEKFFAAVGGRLKPPTVARYEYDAAVFVRRSEPYAPTC
ncbi:MAG TPA: hypothetical protein VM533_08435 [Fimbriiglobus sp.]|jgi:hypothetical protein|nr:hypothetical protein [Fimbriiglobus sp.]